MDIQAEKLHLIQWLTQLTDEKLIARLQSIVKKEMIVGYTADGKPLTMEAYNKRLEQGEADIHAGRITSQEDLEREVENW